MLIRFDRGSLLLEGVGQGSLSPVLSSPPWLWDPRVERFRAPAIVYRDLITALTLRHIPYRDEARSYCELKLPHLEPREPHPYQEEALEAWKKAGRRGVVVLPTGSGKTYLAEMAISLTGRATLVVAPTLDLLNQWYDALSTAFGQEVGIVGGGYFEVRSLTVTTYDSAYLHMEQLGHRFGLLIFDEVHHLPGRAYQQAAEGAIAPFRLGLTATMEREDGMHLRLPDLVGPVVYRRDIRELAGRYLASYSVVRLEAEMTPEEEERYQTARGIYRTFLEANGIIMSGPNGFRQFLSAVNRFEGGRQAFQAYRASREIALAPRAKMEILERLLVRHRRDRVLVFTHENRLAYEISRRFLVPVITHHTDTKERRAWLEGFRQGSLPMLVTSRVLNEGVDVPSANVGVILSGSGSVREHVQRLGRLLRRDADKEAILYEVVTLKTLEQYVSDRRRDHSAYK